MNNTSMPTSQRVPSCSCGRQRGHGRGRDVWWYRDIPVTVYLRLLAI